MEWQRKRRTQNKCCLSLQIIVCTTSGSDCGSFHTALLGPIYPTFQHAIYLVTASQKLCHHYLAFMQTNRNPWTHKVLQCPSAGPCCSVLGILSLHLDDKVGYMGSRQPRTSLWNTPTLPPPPQEPRKMAAVNDVCPFTKTQLPSFPCAVFTVT